MTYRGVVFMDRREALKKLAAGAAVGLAAPTVIGTTAFADSGTVTCLPDPVPNGDAATNLVVEAITNGTNNFVRLRLPTADAALPSTNCPNGYSKLVQFKWELVSAPGTIHFSPNAVSWGDSSQIRVVSITNDVLDVSGDYAVNLNIRVACRTASRVCWKCMSVTIGFNWQYNVVPASSVLSGVSKSAVAGATDCNGTPPGTL